MLVALITAATKSCFSAAVKQLPTVWHWIRLYHWYFSWMWRMLVAIGITNQRETTIVWDSKTGRPLYNAIGLCIFWSVILLVFIHCVNMTYLLS